MQPKGDGITNDQLLYWAIFLLIALVSAMALLAIIKRSNHEQTIFIQSVALSKRPHKTSQAMLRTSEGDITIALDHNAAPSTVNNFIAFALSGFYDETKFHRAVPDFLIKGGDPLSRENDVSLYGTGGPGFVYEDEILDLPMAYGVVAMDNLGRPDTNGSQFFIVLKKDGISEYEGRYTIFGRVIEGIGVAERIAKLPTNEQDVPLDPVVINSIDLK